MLSPGIFLTCCIQVRKVYIMIVLKQERQFAFLLMGPYGYHLQKTTASCRSDWEIFIKDAMASG
jgi:hypothetical protein